MTGDVKFEPSQDLPDFPYASFAESIGLRGIRVDDPARLADAWAQALSPIVRWF
jgi:pyruvate dehydrogenase (quinone)